MQALSPLCNRLVARLCLVLLHLTIHPVAQGREQTPLSLQTPRSAVLQQQLDKALRVKGADYQAQTTHLNELGRPIYTNRLILQDSPYLLQHAHNPVDWFPWGEEAFVRARQANKPVFLSIGYSTCHWCHVMARESFENEAIARLLNTYFVPVKVDREVLPQVDSAYLAAVRLMAGHAGWPLSVWLTPDGKPFLGGAYFAPDRFTQLLTETADDWRTRREALFVTADKTSKALSRMEQQQHEAGKLDAAVIEQAVQQTVAVLDELQGGFGPAPKFPQEPLLYLLLDQVEKQQGTDVAHAAMEALEITLDAMARGGIFDQVGGGFHRYATDNDWQIPHFEKMLYNQAHLGRIYLHAWRITGKDYYRQVAERTLDYALRELMSNQTTSHQGVFYAATDAESEGRDGAFFTWTEAQLQQALAPEDRQLARRLYGITDTGNFAGANILYLAVTPTEYAHSRNISPDRIRQALTGINQRLLQARAQRQSPRKDKKIITAWNGMMITALAEAAVVLRSSRYRDAAIQAATSLWRISRKAEGRLQRIHIANRSSAQAVLADYAFFAEGMLRLYDLTRDQIWLARARELVKAAMDRFSHPDGAFYLAESTAGVNPMGARQAADCADGKAIPSACAVMLQVLGMLSRRTEEHGWRQRAQSLLAAIAGRVRESPKDYGYALTGLSNLLVGEGGSRQYAANGNIRLSARIDSRRTSGRTEQVLSLAIDMPNGWHINSNRPLNKELVPTRVRLGASAPYALTAMRYPKGTRKQLGFQDEPLMVYQGRLVLQGRLQAKPENTAHNTAYTSAHTTAILPVRIQLQACNTRVCLPPEKIWLWARED